MPKKGPRTRHTKSDIIEIIIELRKKNYSINDIKVVLDSKEQKVTIDTIDKILKSEGFAPLPRRSTRERNNVPLPVQIEAPITKKYNIVEECLSTEKAGGILLFLPLIEQKGIVDIIKKIQFPETSIIDSVSSILSFLALKLLGRERLSHDEHWKFDRVLGLFANLNVLPKNATLSSYSYRVCSELNKKFLQETVKLFDQPDGEFNLDFKAIPHWGDESVLEKNWAGSKNKAIKSILAMIVNNPETGYISYMDSEIKHNNQSDAVFTFVDFWTTSSGQCPKMLIFDSKFTNYENLNKLNRSKEKIKFLTLRRRGPQLVKKINNISDEKWKKIKVEGEKRKYRYLKVYEEFVKLRKYEGEIRQLIITDNGREQPAFLVTNDFESSVSVLIRKYARRWLVEQEISEHIDFFQLNHPSSSIVVKVDFDLSLSLLAHNLYKDFSNHLPGFENCTASTIFRKFIDSGAKVVVDKNEKKVLVRLKKKSHLPLILNIPFIKEKTNLAWHGFDIQFDTDTTS